MKTGREGFNLPAVTQQQHSTGVQTPPPGQDDGEGERQGGINHWAKCALAQGPRASGGPWGDSFVAKST